jgi:hypothetical protein
MEFIFRGLKKRLLTLHLSIRRNPSKEHISILNSKLGASSGLLGKDAESLSSSLLPTLTPGNYPGIK